MSDAPVMTRLHHRRLREIYRSAGWPCHDMLEVELLAAGQLERVRSPDGHETLRVTDAGIQTLQVWRDLDRAGLETDPEVRRRLGLLAAADLDTLTERGASNALIADGLTPVTDGRLENGITDPRTGTTSAGSASRSSLSSATRRRLPVCSRSSKRSGSSSKAIRRPSR